MLSVSAGCFQGPPAVESDVLNVLLDHVMVCPVSTVCHILCSVRLQLAHVLSVEFQKDCSSTWGFVRLLMLAKTILQTPVCHHRRHHVISSILLDHLHTWSLSDGVKILWSSMWDDLKSFKPSRITACDDFNKSWALQWAREGRYSNALQALGGCRS